VRCPQEALAPPVRARWKLCLPPGRQRSSQAPVRSKTSGPHASPQHSANSPCRVLKQTTLDVHVGNIDDPNCRIARVAGGYSRERRLAALEDKDSKRAEPIDGQVSELNIDTAPSNPDVTQS